jgi:hypothetical protein
MRNKVQQLPSFSHRVETGAVRFGDDWPGLFIRGDDAFYLALALKKVLASIPRSAIPEVGGEMAVLNGYADMIQRQVVVQGGWRFTEEGRGT